MSKTTMIITDGTTSTFTILGPLTTIFTPPAACLTESYIKGGYLELGIEARTDCFPPGGIGYYSPGLFCPSSYTEAKTMTDWSLLPAEMGSKCCPGGFSLGSDATSSCTQILTSTVSLAGPGGITTGFTKVWSPVIAIIWQDGDLSLPESPGASPTNGTDGGTDVANPGETLSPPPSETGDPSPPGPRNTTTIAIATAVPVVLIALFICGFIFFRRRARSTSTMSRSIPELCGDNDLPKGEAPHWHAPVELPTVLAPPTELPAMTTTDLAPAKGIELPVTPIASPAQYRVESPVETSWAPPPPAALPVIQLIPATTPIDNDEIERLRRERDRVVERRERLLKLEALDDEERQLNLKINERMGGAGGAV